MSCCRSGNFPESRFSLLRVFGTGFSQTNNYTTAVAGELDCTVNLTVVAKVAASVNETLTVTGNASNSPQTLPLTGVGSTAFGSTRGFFKQKISLTRNPWPACSKGYGLRGHLTPAAHRQLLQGFCGLHGRRRNGQGHSLPAWQASYGYSASLYPEETELTSKSRGWQATSPQNT